MRCRCEWLVSNLPAVVGPMQQRLSLPPAALEVAALAVASVSPTRGARLPAIA